MPEQVVKADRVPLVDTTGVVFILIFEFALKELAAPGVGNVNTALFPTASFIVPPFSDKAEVEI